MEFVSLIGDPGPTFFQFVPVYQYVEADPAEVSTTVSAVADVAAEAHPDIFWRPKPFKVDAVGQY